VGEIETMLVPVWVVTRYALGDWDIEMGGVQVCVSIVVSCPPLRQ